jgi:hypothetical protein
VASRNGNRLGYHAAMDEREIEEHDIQSFRESSVYPLMPLLRKGILHRTSIEGYKGICQSGYIMPNKGQFPFSYPQSKIYYGHSMGYICLFDFESSREEDYRINHHTWAKFIRDHEPVTIIFRLNREKLGDKLLPNSHPPKLGEEGHKAFIPFVEVWYPEAIPLSSVDSYIITWWNSESHEIVFQEFSNERFQEFDETIRAIEEMWLELLQEESWNQSKDAT